MSVSALGSGDDVRVSGPESALPLSRISRWIRFNGVGAAGVAIQLLCMAALVSWTGVHVLIATLISVEAAILHNFFWHQRWTWRDRPSRTATAAAARLARFHLTNGIVSLAGNGAIVTALAAAFHVHPVPASAVAIVACSLLNFFASEILVFRTAVIAAVVLASSAAVGAGGQDDDLQPRTAAAWRDYERRVDGRYRALQASGERFFAHDDFARPAGWRDAARKGGVAMAELDAPAPGVQDAAVPDGRVHHWVGAIFVPNTTVDAVVTRLQDRAGQEAGAYDDVVASRLLERQGDRLRVYLKLRRDSIITVTYNTEHSVEYRRLGPGRATSRAVATKIAELSNPGTPGEREKARHQDHGFLWRLNAYWRYEQADGGVFIECESVSLSRSVPVLIRPLVNGVVEGIARESLEKTLVSLRSVLRL
jgi:putative flippase GtrA